MGRGSLFTFDRFGNLTQVQTTGQMTENFPTTETTNRMSNAIATYDSRGNLTTYNDGTTSFTNSFDALNRQWKRLAPDGTDDYYLYTADDERILTFSPSTAMAWHWILRDFGGKVLRNYEFINSEAPAADFVAGVKDYIHAGERVLGTEDPRVPGASAMYATVDHLGTPRLWTDATGNDVRKLKYYPFGKEATPSDQWSVALQFTGHERDRNDLALATDDGDYMHARNASPVAARFLAADPLLAESTAKPLPQGWNRYSYTMGNPLKLVDPTGALVEYASDAEKALAEELATKNPIFKARLDRLKESKDVFRIQYGNPTGGDAEGSFSYTGSGRTFDITIGAGASSYTPEQILSHETRHATDFLDGRFGFAKQGGDWKSWQLDLNDEVRGFEAMLETGSTAEKSGIMRGKTGDLSRLFRAGTELAGAVSKMGRYGKLPTADLEIGPTLRSLQGSNYVVTRE